MIERHESRIARLAPLAHYHVVALVAPRRDRRVQQIGKPELPVAQFLLYGLEPAIGRFDLASQQLAPRQERSDVIATALGLTDGLGMAVVLGTQPVALELPLTPLALECVER